MNNLLFILLSYGITNIMVFGSIFETWRVLWNKVNPSFFGKLFNCPLCLSTWIGGVLSYTFNQNGCVTPFSSYGVVYFPLIVFLDGCLTSGCVWLIHNFEEALERVFKKD